MATKSFPPQNGWCGLIGPLPISCKNIYQEEWTLLVDCWGKMTLLYWSHAFKFFFFFFPLFARIFIHTFIAFTYFVRIYLTIAIFIVFISTLFHLRMYADTIDINIFSVPFQFFKVHNIFLLLFKIQFVLQKLSHRTHGYFFDIICCCARESVRWSEDFFHIHKYWYNRYKFSKYLCDGHSQFSPFLDVLRFFSSQLLPYILRVSSYLFVLLLHIRVTLILVNSSSFSEVIPEWFFLLTCFILTD